jgi:hypothetical protein
MLLKKFIELCYIGTPAARTQRARIDLQRVQLPLLWQSLQGSVADPDPLVRLLLSLSKNSNKNIDSYCFVTFYDFSSLKNDVNVLYHQRVISKKRRKKTVDVLKVTD